MIFKQNGEFSNNFDQSQLSVSLSIKRRMVLCAGIWKPFLSLNPVKSQWKVSKKSHPVWGIKEKGQLW